MKKLSIIIPCYNEPDLVTGMIRQVSEIPLPNNLDREIIIVDDGSTDNTPEQLAGIALELGNLILLRNHINSGKGFSIRRAIERVTGDIVVIQDADLEYDPRNYHLMLPPILEGRADVVYGSRFIGTGPHRVLFFFHSIGNKFLTFLSNLFTGLNLTDMETGHKMFLTGVLKRIRLDENRFGFEPEVTARISRLPRIRIYEVGIPYYGRTYDEGKKISWQDGFHALWCILKYNIFSRG